jgi:hypothetical protein
MSPTKFQLPSLVDRSSMEREVGIFCGIMGEDLQSVSLRICGRVR